MAIFPGRYSAKIEGDFVVFLIGVRLNRLLLVHQWMPVFLAMPRMLAELRRQPELGLLHARIFLSGKTILVLQYWRSFEQLHAYAHAADRLHLPAWAEFNRAIGNNGSVGIFHESYLVRPGGYETIYVNMPPTGLGRAGELVPATGNRETARDRLGAC
jgi:hypothetical protein